MLPLDEVDELVAELLVRMPLVVLLRGSSPCNVDERIRAYRHVHAACRRSPLYLGATSAIPDPTLAAELMRANAADGQQA